MAGRNEPSNGLGPFRRPLGGFEKAVARRRGSEDLGESMGRAIRPSWKTIGAAPATRLLGAARAGRGLAQAA
jgi:hypothetical protein